jgi:hypothetical protein
MMQSYYHEKFCASDTAAPDPSSSVPSPREAEDDRWTLNHIRVALNVQQLIDAIDTDDNGLVNFKEVNDFVRRRPCCRSRVQGTATVLFRLNILE